MLIPFYTAHLLKSEITICQKICDLCGWNFVKQRHCEFHIIGDHFLSKKRQEGSKHLFVIAKESKRLRQSPMYELRYIDHSVALLESASEHSYCSENPWEIASSFLLAMTIAMLETFIGYHFHPHRLKVSSLRIEKANAPPTVYSEL